MTTTLATTTNVIPAKAGTHDTLQHGCALGGVVLAEACVDGRLRGHDGMGRAAGAAPHTVIPALVAGMTVCG